MTGLEKKVSTLKGSDLAALRYRAEEGIASDDELVLHRMYYADLSESEARKNLDEYRKMFDTMIE